MSSKSMHNEEISSVGIIGCGWLGKALAIQLQSQGVKVLATRSSETNVKELEQQGIKSELLNLPAEQQNLNRHPIFNQQCLVIAITPQFRHGRVDYAEKVKQLVDAATMSRTVKKVIILSSTAVYNGLTGIVDENSTLDHSADKVTLLNEAEQSVLSFNQTKSGDLDKNAFVLRLSGLVGPHRHPGKFLLNGRMLKTPQAIVNLIHQKDAVGLILSLLESSINGGIFNGVSATQISKKAYYQAAAKALAMPMPRFDESVNLSEESELLGNASKIVSGKKSLEALGYSFVHDDLVHWLEQDNQID